MKRYFDLIYKLRDLCIKDCEQFIVTGGVALERYGLVQSEEVSDLDIILVNPNEELLKTLRKLEQVSPIKDRCCYLAGKEGLVRFTLDGINIDVFIEKTMKRCVYSEHLSLNPLMDILTAKKRYGRAKDNRFICDLVAKIVTFG